MSAPRILQKLRFQIEKRDQDPDGGRGLCQPSALQLLCKEIPLSGCGRKRYAQVLNINEINRAMEKPMLRTGMRWLLLMCIGGMLILAAAAVPMHFLNQARERQVEELREQRYEELKDRLE